MSEGADFNELMITKLAFLERLMLDVLEDQIANASDPSRALKLLIETRMARKEPPKDAFEEHAELLRQEVRQEFFDQLRSGLERRLGRKL